jgi:CRP-like cAMP-binding protein
LRKAKSPETAENRLWAALSKPSREALISKMERVPLSVGDILYHPGDAIAFVYFPVTCVISMMTEMKNGTTIEIATIGNEGMLGIAAYLGIDVAVSKAIVQVDGEVLRMKAEELKREVKKEDRLDTLLRRYTHALLTQIARSGGCNSLHSVEERYARWLLMMHDRTNVDVFAFTQEFLSEMLGVSRPRVNIVAGTLEKAGLVKHARKRITVLNWEKLEASSCDCYRVIKEEFDRLRIY